jgi:hypothetical protein
LIVPCTGTGISLLPLTKGGPSKGVSLCNLCLVLGYPERGSIFSPHSPDHERRQRGISWLLEHRVGIIGQSRR